MTTTPQNEHPVPKSEQLIDRELLNMLGQFIATIVPDKAGFALVIWTETVTDHDSIEVTMRYTSNSSKPQARGVLSQVVDNLTADIDADRSATRH